MAQLLFEFVYGVDHLNWYENFIDSLIDSFNILSFILFLLYYFFILFLRTDEDKYLVIKNQRESCEQDSYLWARDSC